MPPEIATARLLLRPPAAADLDAIVAEIGEPRVARMLARVPHPYRRADAEAFLASCRENADRDLSLVIEAEGRVIGGIGLSGLRSEREFGYWLGSRHWGKGYATEAGVAFLAHVFGPAGVDIVRSGVFKDNPASLRVQEKLGFEVVGSRKARSLARNADVDHIDTLLTAGRFLALHPA